MTLPNAFRSEYAGVCAFIDSISKIKSNVFMWIHRDAIHVFLSVSMFIAPIWELEFVIANTKRDFITNQLRNSIWWRWMSAEFSKKLKFEAELIFRIVRNLHFMLNKTTLSTWIRWTLCGYHVLNYAAHSKSVYILFIFKLFWIHYYAVQTHDEHKRNIQEHLSSSSQEFVFRKFEAVHVSLFDARKWY